MSTRQETIDESILPRRNSSRGKGKKISKPGFSWRAQSSTWGYIALGLFVFFLVLFLKFPFERLSGRILETLSSQTNLDWDASHVSVGLLLGPKVTFENLTIRPSVLYRPMAGDPVAKIIGDGIAIERLSFRPSLWHFLAIPGLKASAMGGSFSVTAFGGAEFDGSFSYGAQTLSLDLDISALDLAKFPGTKGIGAGNMPGATMPIFDLSGKIQSASLALSAPKGRIGTSSGSIDIRGEGLRLVQVGNIQNSILPSLDAVQLGKLHTKARIANGLMTIQEFSQGAKDTDLETKIEGTLRLSDAIEASEYNAILSLTLGGKLTPFIPALSLGPIRFERKENTFSSRVKGNFLTIPESTPYRSGG